MHAVSPWTHTGTCTGCGGPRDSGAFRHLLPNPCAAPPATRAAATSVPRADRGDLRLTIVDHRRPRSQISSNSCRCMGGFQTFTEDAKKFSPKKHRERVGAMSGKPCPLHDLGRKRPCKQATNPLDVCSGFQPNRSRCAHAKRPRPPPASTNRSPRAHAISCSLAFADPRRRRRRPRRRCGTTAPTTFRRSPASTTGWSAARAHSTACRRRSTAA